MVRGKELFRDALGDAHVLGPGDGVAEVAAFAHVLEGGRLCDLRLACQAVQGGDQHAPGELPVGSELAVAHAVHETVTDDVIRVFVVPLVSVQVRVGFAGTGVGGDGFRLHLTAPAAGPGLLAGLCAGGLFGDGPVAPEVAKVQGEGGRLVHSLVVPLQLPQGHLCRAEVLAPEGEGGIGRAFGSACRPGVAQLQAAVMVLIADHICLALDAFQGQKGRVIGQLDDAIGTLEGTVCRGGFGLRGQGFHRGEGLSLGGELRLGQGGRLCAEDLAVIEGNGANAFAHVTQEGALIAFCEGIVSQPPNLGGVAGVVGEEESPGLLVGP